MDIDKKQAISLPYLYERQSKRGNAVLRFTRWTSDAEDIVLEFRHLHNYGQKTYFELEGTRAEWARLIALIATALVTPDSEKQP